MRYPYYYERVYEVMSYVSNNPDDFIELRERFGDLWDNFVAVFKEED